MSSTSDPVPATSAAPQSSRLTSLDALRGFDMFWIVGGEELIHALRKISDSDVVRVLDDQMDHVPWEGFHFYDLIFPLFVFVVGVSLVFSLGRTLAQEGRAAVINRVLRRAVLLYLLGLFYYGGFELRGDYAPFHQIRLLGVLQRIALAYLFAGLAFCFLSPRAQVVCCIGLLVGYWALLTYIPVPGVGSGDFTEGKNLANYIDQQYLPLRKWDGDHDPEGLLSTLPAIATCLLGVFAGALLKSTRFGSGWKVFALLGGGLVLLALGWLWNEQLPVIKKIWTSSFVLVAGGYSCLLLGAFYLVIDVWRLKAWAQPFIWVGMNAITIYMVHDIVNFDRLAQRLVGGDLKPYFGQWHALVSACVVVAMTLGLCHFLYRRKIFLRL
jgi:predicted acyltransferase